MSHVKRMASGATVHSVAARGARTKSTRPRQHGRQRSLWGVTATLGFATLPAIALLWVAINRLPSVGPWLADTARYLFGSEAVAKVEEWAYGVDDRWNRCLEHAEWLI
jgi:hypothetical protein